MTLIDDFQHKGEAAFLLGGQWGSEGKGAAAAWLASEQIKAGIAPFTYVTTNAGSQSGHTSVHAGRKRIAYHLPTVPLVQPGSSIYLNAGAILDVEVLERELAELPDDTTVYVHPNAAVITPECKDAEKLASSPQTRIASTQKGVGEALARKVLRSGVVAKDCESLRPFLRRIDLNSKLAMNASVLVEVPQGIGLSLNSSFYPYCTSRDCTVMQAMSDAAIHPTFVGSVMLVLRTYPIRVGNIPGGTSGDCYPDQKELNWKDLGVEPELTTVTGRVRRVFSFSTQQLIEAMASARPTHVFISHCDYYPGDSRLSKVDDLVGKINKIAQSFEMRRPRVACSFGPTTDDVQEWSK